MEWQSHPTTVDVFTSGEFAIFESIDATARLGPNGPRHIFHVLRNGVPIATLHNPADAKLYAEHVAAGGEQGAGFKPAA